MNKSKYTAVSHPGQALALLRRLNLEFALLFPAISIALFSMLFFPPLSAAEEKTDESAKIDFYKINDTKAIVRIAVFNREAIIESWEKCKQIANELQERINRLDKFVASSNATYERSKKSGISAARLNNLHASLQAGINSAYKETNDWKASTEQALEDALVKAIEAEAKLRDIDLVVATKAVLALIPRSLEINLTEAIKGRLNYNPVDIQVTAAPPSKSLRFAVVDRDNVIASYARANKAAATLKSAEIDAKQLLDSSNARYEERKAAGASTNELASLQAELQSAINERYKTAQNLAQNLENSLEQEINSTLASVARQHNVNVVFTKPAALQIMPESLNTDLTADVIKALNGPGTSTQAVCVKVSAPDMASELESLSKEIQLQPKNADLYLARSFVCLAAGSDLSSFSDAKLALEIASSNTPKNSRDEFRQQMAVILMCLKCEKCNEKETETTLLRQAKVRCIKSQWPYPLISYLAGERTEAAILPPDSTGQIEKNLVLGFRKLIQGKAAAAKANFRAAQQITASRSEKTNYKRVAAAMLSILN